MKLTRPFQNVDVFIIHLEEGFPNTFTVIHIFIIIIFIIANLR